MDTPLEDTNYAAELMLRRYGYKQARLVAEEQASNMLRDDRPHIQARWLRIIAALDRMGMEEKVA
jgi:hypothetical protein